MIELIHEAKEDLIKNLAKDNLFINCFSKYCFKFTIKITINLFSSTQYFSFIQVFHRLSLNKNKTFCLYFFLWKTLWNLYHSVLFYSKHFLFIFDKIVIGEKELWTTRSRMKLPFTKKNLFGVMLFQGWGLTLEI